MARNPSRYVSPGMAGLFHIEVSDDDPRIDRVTPSPHSAYSGHGRGLVLTDRLAASWGVHEVPSGMGKTVWADVV
jgi:hypothetical protein